MINEIQSSIPFCIRGFSSLDAKTDRPLRVKRHTVIFTGQQNYSNSNEEMDEQEAVSSNHITTYACDNLDSKIELVKTPEAFKDGGQATFDELKELDLGTNEEPRPIYVSSSLTPEEEKQCL